MKVPINLASQPFRRDRPMIVASVALSIVLVLSLGALIALAISDRNQMKDTRREIAALNAHIRESAKEKATADTVLRQPQNADVLERSLFINSLLYRKGISWTVLLRDLEKVMPPNVRVLNIRPYVNGSNRVALDLVVGAEAPESVITLYKALEGSDVFGALNPVSMQPPTQSEPLYRYRFTVNYAQKLS